jgi:beta-aspartyl-peptidase (threonine type)
MKSDFAIAIHGGAGAIPRASMSDVQEAQYRAVLSEALCAGRQVLAAGDTALDAVCQALRVMEDSPLFNAGRGSVFTHEGEIEMDAAVMVGRTRAAGAVCQLKSTRNPILAARAVMENSDHVLLGGAGAEAFAQSVGLQTEPIDYFRTETRWQQLLAAREDDRFTLDNDLLGQTGVNQQKFGTVGAVALDRSGGLAAATSTGGMTNKRWGRIGDSPILGAGTWADDTVAVSATGVGELFIRACAAHEISARMRFLHEDLLRASSAVLDDVARLGGRGGLIVIDAEGHIAMPFNTAGMFRGRVCSASDIEIAIYSD